MRFKIASKIESDDNDNNDDQPQAARDEDDDHDAKMCHDDTHHSYIEQRNSLQRHLLTYIESISMSCAFDRQKINEKQQGR